MLYLDNNATTQPAPEAVSAVNAALVETWHNPSSVHRAGQNARRVVELARQAVADLIGAKPKSITFTSGGTEAIDLGIRGVLEATGKRVLVTSRVEHAAVRDLAEWLGKREGVEVRWAAVDARGVVQLDSVRSLVDDSTAAVCVQWANNETGVIQPVREIAALCRERRTTFLCDATQWIGKMPANVEGADALDADLVVFSAHKWHGPKGVGVLYARAGARVAPRLHGAQEKGRRGGTENVPGIAGAGAAAAVARQWLEQASERERLAALRDRFERAVVGAIPDAVVNGAGGERLWNTTNIGFPALEAEALLLLMSEKGLCASAGAACSSGSLDPSPVLLAMGIAPAVAHGSVRFSLSRATTAAEIDEGAGIVAECVSRLRRSMA